MYNDHVTVWSSVFLDVERTQPIKAYKWFAYKIPDLSISMEEFKNRSKVNARQRLGLRRVSDGRSPFSFKPVNLMISIAQPVLNPPENVSRAARSPPCTTTCFYRTQPGNGQDHSTGCRRRRYPREAPARILAEISSTTSSPSSVRKPTHHCSS